MLEDLGVGSSIMPQSHDGSYISHDTITVIWS